MPLFGGGKKAEAASTMQVFTTKLNETTTAIKTMKDEMAKQVQDRDSAFKFLAEKVKTVTDTVEKLGQGIPTNPALEAAARDLPTFKAQMVSSTQRLTALERSMNTISENVAMIAARLEMPENTPQIAVGSSPAVGLPPSRSGSGWGSRNIQSQIQSICRDLVRALPKEFQESAAKALEKATLAFMNQFLKEFSHEVKDVKPQPSRLRAIPSSATVGTAPEAASEPAA